MFSLISGFWKIFFAKVEVQVLILGLDHAGKTTLLEQMKGLFNKQQGIPPERIPPTIGLNIGKMDVGTCRVIFWDLGGQVRMRSIWEKYYAEAHGMVFVIDSADVGRMEEAKLAFDAVREHEELRGIPVLLLANKQDLPGAMAIEDIAMHFEIHNLPPRLVRLQPASCLTCEGIEDGVRWVVEESRTADR
mmetsp:Transcript_30243/g.70108  ORF Transcript_30243/g.70108 Transcript_30243/m.70108 type:complete len:190 (-) Transcript_30243:52-621(-)|eukprot:CAMPEP_0182548060 /NCGR_PEP_ID=MMETSP1323-20130603/38310_1 /TAXON_ID=236787 /ORGANISM="Florenciella parvula, Strain RCC1693" /LENGTH=189 /DNA_ID=CAMNT_0024759423 /DNA_START=171 /DNA_END=740 /DNA_ORIENTATION=-